MSLLEEPLAFSKELGVNLSQDSGPGLAIRSPSPPRGHQWGPAGGLVRGMAAGQNPCLPFRQACSPGRLGSPTVSDRFFGCFSKDVANFGAFAHRWRQGIQEHHGRGHHVDGSFSFMSFVTR